MQDLTPNHWQDLTPNHWTVQSDFADTPGGKIFADLDSVFALQGELIARDPISSVIRVQIAEQRFYIKRYHRAGKGLRRILGRSRIRAEWENLAVFKRLGIRTAPIVAYGEQRHYGKFVRGALITAEIPGTIDLARLAKQNSPLFQDPVWLDAVLKQVAYFSRLLHDAGFIHTDLKWRNVLVDDSAEPQVFFIDCPSGRFLPQPFLARNIIKDLACLDKVGSQILSQTQRLRFYKCYSGSAKLTRRDKKNIRKIRRFFLGEELI